jgi:DHA2 family multidrug resistance protein
MMTGLGIAGFSSVVLMPQFAQNVLGYSAQDAGIVMSPGALMLLPLIPLGARIAAKSDPRLMVSIGFAMMAAGTMATAHWTNPAIGQTGLVLLRMAQVSGFAFLMVPISMLSYAGLPPGESGNSSALLNLMRNLGSSLGISLAVTWLERSTQSHQVQLVEHVSVLDPAYQSYARAISGTFDAATTPAFIASVIQKQAMVLGFIDDYHRFATIALLLAVGIWFNRRPAQVAPPPSAAH